MANAILGLLAETSLHAGASASAGVIDLPIQREAHTGWPCVFGSGVKGALRTAAHDQNATWEDEVFGPPTKTASEHAGALSVGDGRLLLLPVRSLTGHFKWVTCPALLRRAVADSQRLGFSTALSLDDLSPQDEVALIPQATPKAPQAGAQDNPAQGSQPRSLFLEEISFTEQQHDLSGIVEFLAHFMNVPDAVKLLKKQLAIVSDDIFAHLSQFATPVGVHIAIEYETKTVKDGALWYEETLPPETVLYVCLLAQKSRKHGSEKSDQEVLRHLTQDLFQARPYVQLGGNETVGMGWCKVQVLTPAILQPSTRGGE